MLSWIVKTSLQLRVVVVALAAVSVVAGFRAATVVPLDVFPEFAPPRIEIQVEAPGLSTEEVESLITVPLESALNATPWLTTLRSKSVLGLASIVLYLEEDVDLMEARQLVQERLAIEAPRLPAVAKPPVMLSPLSSLSRVLKIGMSSKKLSQVELTTLAKWTIRPHLMAVPGVANVAIWGQRDRQLQVRVDPDRLRLHGVSLDQVVRAAGDATVVSAGGFVDTPVQRIPIRHAAAVQTVEELARAVVVESDQGLLRLGDVADVVEGHPVPIGDAVINDGPGLLLIVEKQPWGNTLEVTRKVETALDALRPGLSDVEIDSTIFRPATFIERSIDNLTDAMFLGALLVAIILVMFLFNWRTAAISLVAIPLSILGAILVLYWRGGTINVMTLAGLVIAVGEVVDDAIIDVENIARRLRLNALAGSPVSSFRVVLRASLEVRSAVVFASMIVILVFVPIFFLEGLAGTFFRPLAVSYILAILVSLLVALTVTPALSYFLLPGANHVAEDSRLVQWLKEKYRNLLPRLLFRPARVGWSVAAILLATVLSIPLLGEEFLPSFQETDFLMHWVEKPGTSLDALTRSTINVSRELRAIPGVRNFGAHLGRAEVADEVVGPNFCELWISVEPEADFAATLARIQAVIDEYPGIYRDVLTYLKERIKEVLTGSSASIVVRLFGPDLAILRDKAQEVQRVMAEVPGVADLHVETQTLVPQILVRLKPDAATLFGLTAGDVRRAATTLLQGVKVGEIFEGQKIFDVAVMGDSRLRVDPNGLKDLLIDLPRGGHARLGDVADIAIVPAPNEIKRESASRRIDITCNAKGRDLGSVARDVEAKVRSLSFDREYHPEFLGEFEARQASQRRLLVFSFAAFAGIVVLLYVEFQSARLTALILLTLAFSLVGGVAAAFLTGGVLSLGSLVGFVTVIGIAGRNGIMMVSHYEHLLREEGECMSASFLLRGAEERLSPILMTALSTGLGLVPLVIAGNRPGHEIEYPLAVVITGGLVTSTLMNLVFVPALYRAFRKPD